MIPATRKNEETSLNLNSQITPQRVQVVYGQNSGDSSLSASNANQSCLSSLCEKFLQLLTSLWRYVASLFRDSSSTPRSIEPSTPIGVSAHHQRSPSSSAAVASTPETTLESPLQTTPSTQASAITAAKMVQPSTPSVSLDSLVPEELTKEKWLETVVSSIRPQVQTASALNLLERHSLPDSSPLLNTSEEYQVFISLHKRTDQETQLLASCFLIYDPGEKSYKLKGEIRRGEILLPFISLARKPEPDMLLKKRIVQKIPGSTDVYSYREDWLPNGDAFSWRHSQAKMPRERMIKEELSYELTQSGFSEAELHAPIIGASSAPSDDDKWLAWDKKSKLIQAAKDVINQASNPYLYEDALPPLDLRRHHHAFLSLHTTSGRIIDAIALSYDPSRADYKSHGENLWKRVFLDDLTSLSSGYLLKIRILQAVADSQEFFSYEVNKQNQAQEPEVESAVIKRVTLEKDAMQWLKSR